MKKALAILIVIILALAAGFAGGIYYAKNYSKDKLTQGEVEETVLGISELATLEQDYTENWNYEGDAKKLFGHDVPFTKKSMQIQYSGVAKMGPNLDKNMKIVLNDASDTVTVTIPHSEILSNEVDEESIKIVTIKNGLFNFVTPEDTNYVRKEAKKDKTKRIEDSDLLDKADDYAVEQITSFLNSVYPDVTVKVEVKDSIFD